jgi:hypothetical protein
VGNSGPAKVRREDGSMNKNVRRSAKALDLPKVDKKIMPRSHQRSGVVGGGTLLNSGKRQMTVVFTPPTFHKLKLAADLNGISLSEMVRQCVDIALEKRE